ncbi:MAG: hypothetical protein AVDCRST_MAG18-1492, partial [uncultured Thermomicrobiales bacterium]
VRNPVAAGGSAARRWRALLGWLLSDPAARGRRGGAARGARPRCLTRRAVAGGAECHRIRAV